MLIDSIAWLGSGLVLLSLVQRDMVRLHLLNIVASAAFLVYDIALALHPMTALNTILLVVSVVQAARLRPVPTLARPDPCPVPERWLSMPKPPPAPLR